MPVSLDGGLDGPTESSTSIDGAQSAVADGLGGAREDAGDAPVPDAEKALLSDAGDATAADLTSEARLVLDQTEASFTAVVGCASDGKRFRVSNAGGRPSGPLSATVGADFKLSSDGCTGLSLAPGQSCELEVKFQPFHLGLQTAILSMKGDPGGEARVRLTGQALAVVGLVLTPNAATFDPVKVGETGRATTFELRYLSGSTAEIAAPSISTTDFLITSRSCAGSRITGNSVCSFEVAFRPQGAGQRSAILTVSAATGCGIETALATLTGTAEAATGLVISERDQDLGWVPQHCKGQPHLFRISNADSVPTGPLSVALTGPYQITTNGCAGATLAPGVACEVSVVFAPPNQLGPFDGMLVVTGSHGGTQATLHGRSGTVDGLVLTPSQHEFGVVHVGEKSPPQEFLISLMALSPDAPFTITITGEAAADYAISSTACTGLLKGGTNCTLRVTFTPKQIGERTASLLVDGGCGDTPSALLRGLGN
jgi:hypothetical protein